MIKNNYNYNIYKEYDRTVFAKITALLTKSIENIETSEYFEDPLDGDQIQILKTSAGEVKIVNDFMVGAVWVESEINLDYIFKKEFNYA